MNTILSPDPQLTAFDDEKLLKLLAHTSGPIRARAIPTLGPRAAQAPPLMEVLFGAAADPSNLTLVFYAFIKVAWVAAITILDYGTENDLVRLQKVIQAWPQAEQQGFLAYVKDYRNFDKLFAEKLLEANQSKRRQDLP
jgi:hypothetical protein